MGHPVITSTEKVRSLVQFVGLFFSKITGKKKNEWGGRTFAKCDKCNTSHNLIDGRKAQS